MPARVSIIIPAFIATPEQSALLDETLCTVATQTCGDYEVIVVDDGSPLDVAAVVRRHRHAVSVRQPNAGPAAARNTGIEASRGEYLVFLDADDHLLPPALEVGLAALDAHPECEFTVGPREEMSFDGEPVPWVPAVPPRESEIYAGLLAFDWYIIPPSSCMFRRDVVERVGGFRNPWGADDLDFYLRVARASRAWCYQSPAVTRYRRYSTSSSRDGERMLNSVREVYARQAFVVDGDPVLEPAFARGLSQLTEIFLDCVVENIQDRVRSGDRARAVVSARLLAVESPDRWAALLRGPDSAIANLAHDLSLEPDGTRRQAAR